MTDPVKAPPHYVDGRKYEPRRVIADWALNFNLGSALKYIARAGRKGNKVEDLCKAIQFLQFEIEEMTANAPTPTPAPTPPTVPTYARGLYRRVHGDWTPHSTRTGITIRPGDVASLVDMGDHNRYRLKNADYTGFTLMGHDLWEPVPDSYTGPVVGE